LIIFIGTNTNEFADIIIIGISITSIKSAGRKKPPKDSKNTLKIDEIITNENTIENNRYTGK